MPASGVREVVGLLVVLRGEVGLLVVPGRLRGDSQPSQSLSMAGPLQGLVYERLSLLGMKATSGMSLVSLIGMTTLVKHLEQTNRPQAKHWVDQVNSPNLLILHLKHTLPLAKSSREVSASIPAKEALSIWI